MDPPTSEGAPEGAAGHRGAPWPLVCPACRGPLDVAAAAAEPALRCGDCAATYPERRGIPDLVLPERRPAVEAFVAEYEAIRLAEGRGEGGAARLRALPHVPADDPRPWEWRVRAASLRVFERRVLAGRSALAVVDLGAGVGWLSRRLAELGHHPLAVDVSLHPEVGLGAARRLGADGRPPFPCARAEFDRLPLAAGVADLCVFNASFHYAADYAATLGESLRVLAPGGRVVLVDSPFYRRRESGEAMVAERRRRFVERHGFASDRHGGREFLTWDELARLGDRLDLDWRVLRPWYGLRYALLPWVARLGGRREPSRFAVVVGSPRRP